MSESDDAFMKVAREIYGRQKASDLAAKDAEIARLRITLAKLYDIAASGSDPLERRRMLDRLGMDSFAEDG